MFLGVLVARAKIKFIELGLIETFVLRPPTVVAMLSIGAA